VVDLVWSVANRLGYSNLFVDTISGPGGDDHFSFTSRKVPSVDIISLNNTDTPYWHTPEDTLDKVSPKTLAYVGHTILESVHELEKR
jgi:Zn-dependent M28 family amino/carboxypeptidase